MINNNSFIFKLLVLVIVAVFTITASSCAKEALSTTTSGVFTDVTKIGQGTKEFILTVVFADDSKYFFEIKTDKATLAEALLEYDLIGGDKTELGLLVTSVCGVEHKYENGKWWQLQINGEMAPAGVSQTEITPGASYSLVATNA
jgi:hypothetical protein